MPFSLLCRARCLEGRARLHLLSSLSCPPTTLVLIPTEASPVKASMFLHLNLMAVGSLSRTCLSCLIPDHLLFFCNPLLPRVQCPWTSSWLSGRSFPGSSVSVLPTPSAVAILRALSSALSPQHGHPRWCSHPPPSCGLVHVNTLRTQQPGFPSVLSTSIPPGTQ